MNQSLKIISLILCFFTASLAHAAITGFTISGYTNVVSDAVGSYKIFVGKADLDSPGGASLCTNPTASEVPCDSCAMMKNAITATGQTVCNQNSIYPGFYLVVTLRSDKTEAFPAGAKVVMAQGSNFVPADVITPEIMTANTDITARFTWSNICGKLKTSADCPNSFTETVQLGFAPNGSAAPTEFVTLQINFRNANDAISTAFHSDCSETVPTPANLNEGGCSFDIFPGDEKVYVNVGVPAPSNGASGGVGTWPSPGGTTTSGVSYAGVRMYYRQATTLDEDALTAIDWAMAPADGITQYKDIAISADGSISSNKVTGLINETLYTFMMATYDQAGNITNFSNTQSNDFLTVARTGYHYGTPAKVVGLLDGKGCFIATATYGSSMAPQVKLLRKFRDEFMLTNSFGRSLAKFYYSVSPQLAENVSGSGALRLISLAALWPIVKSIELGYSIGFIPTILVLLIVGLIFRELSRRLLFRLGWK